MRRPLAWTALPALALVVWAVAPLATGERTLVLRDVLNTHLALRAGPAEVLRAFELPLVDPLRGGQPALGNANAVLFYPDNLLLLFGSTLWQLNAHFWLHWLAAFASMYWLARVWGVSQSSAAAGAAAYGLSGYFLSQLNLYNAVAAAALAPALAAAALEAGSLSHRRRGVVAAGAIWSLLLLGGDPLLAFLALAFAVAVAGGRHGRGWVRWRLAIALAAGTLVAAPQIVETARIWRQSYRGFLGGVPGGGVRGPATLIDLLVPLFFGSPASASSWSNAHFGGFPPLYFSLFPGALVLALGVAAGLPRRREARLALALALGGAAIVYFGATLPGRWLAGLAGGLFRYPDKLALWPALGASLAVAAACERWRPGARARRLAFFSASLGTLLLAFGTALRIHSKAATWLAEGLAGAGGAEIVPPGERIRWAGSATGIGLTLLALAATWLFFARPGRGGRPAAVACAVLIQTASQLVLLAPLRLNDESERYRSAPAVAALLSPSAVAVHGGYGGLFGSVAPPARDGDYLSLQRAAQSELAPFAAALDRRRLELVVSPEGLSHFTVHALAQWMRRATDTERLALLAATGVDRLLLSRPLEDEPESRARPIASRDASGGARALTAYEVAPTLPPALLAGTIEPAPDLGAALARITAHGFDPRLTAVVAGDGAPVRGPAGAAEIVRELREEIELGTDAPRGGVLVVRRAFLPIWSVEIDGAASQTLVANASRLAVEVPPGQHRVRFFVSRAPLRWALVAAVVGLAVLAALVFRRP